MARLFKYVIIIAAGLIVLLVGTALILRVMFPPEKLREIVTAQINQNIGRTCTFGSVGFSVWHGFALDVSDFRIAEDPAFTNSFLFHTDHFILKVKWLPLISKRIEIDRFTLVRPELYYVINKKGITNIEGIYAGDSVKTPNQTPSSADGSAAFALLLHTASISEGILHYIDEQASLELTVAPFDNELSFSFDAESLLLTLEGNAEIGGIETNPSSELIHILKGLTPDISYLASIDLGSGRVSVEHCNVNIPGISLKCSGKIQDFRSTPAEFSLAWEGRVENIKEILRFVPPSMADITKYTDFNGEIDITGKAGGNSDFEPAPEFQNELFLREGRGRVTAFPRELRELNAEIIITNQSVEIKELSMEIGDDPFQLSGKVGLTEAYPFSATIQTSLNLNDLPRIVPMLSDWKTAGKVTADLSFLGKGIDMSGFRLTGSFMGSDIVVNNPDMPKAVNVSDLRIEGRGESIQLNGSASAGESRAHIEATVNNYASLMQSSGKDNSASPDWRFNVTSPMLNEADFVMPIEETEGGINPEPEEDFLPLPFIDLQGEGTLKVQKFNSSDGVVVEDVDILLRADKRIVTFDKINGKLYSGNIDGTGKIILDSQKPPAYVMDMELQNVKIDNALSSVSSFSKYVTGLMSSTVHVEGKGVRYEEIMKSLTSQGRMSIKEGTIAGWPLLSELANWSRISEWEFLSFLDWHGEYYVENERFYSKDLTIETSQGRWKVAGSMGFDSSLDYTIHVALSPGLTQKYLSILSGKGLFPFTDEEGRVLLGFHVTGQPVSPKISWDTSALKQNVRNQVTGQIKKITDRLLPFKEGDTGSTDSTHKSVKDSTGKNKFNADSTAKKVVDQLKNLFRKKK